MSKDIRDFAALTVIEAPTVRYLARCPRCKTPHAVDVQANRASEFLTRAFNDWTQRCRNCDRVLQVWKAVSGRVSLTHKCDPRCTGAIGPNCECECGGHNHGADHL